MEFAAQWPQRFAVDFDAIRPQRGDVDGFIRVDRREYRFRRLRRFHERRRARLGRRDQPRDVQVVLDPCLCVLAMVGAVDREQIRPNAARAGRLSIRLAELVNRFGVDQPLPSNAKAEPTQTSPAPPGNGW